MTLATLAVCHFSTCNTYGMSDLLSLGVCVALLLRVQDSQLVVACCLAHKQLFRLRVVLAQLQRCFEAVLGSGGAAGGRRVSSEGSTTPAPMFSTTSAGAYTR